MMTTCRKTFMLDEQTLAEVEVVQRALRATSASEALRFSIRKMADFVRARTEGKRVVVHSKNNQLVVDIPTLEGTDDTSVRPPKRPRKKSRR